MGQAARQLKRHRLGGLQEVPGLQKLNPFLQGEKGLLTGVSPLCMFCFTHYKRFMEAKGRLVVQVGYSDGDVCVSIAENKKYI